MMNTSVIYLVLVTSVTAVIKCHTEFRLGIMDVDTIHSTTIVFAAKQAQTAVLKDTGVCLVPVLISDVTGDYCSAANPMVATYFDIVHRYNINSILGPDCDTNLEIFAMLASRSGQTVPVLQFEVSFIDQDKSNGANLGAAASVLPSARKEAKALWSLLVAFGWTHNIGILATNSVPDLDGDDDALQAFYIRRSRGSININMLDFNSESADEMRAALIKMKTLARSNQNEVLLKDET